MLDALGRLRSDHKHFRLYILYIPTPTHSALVTIATTIYISEPSTRGNSFSTPSQITPSDSLIGHYMHFKLECVSIHCKTTCFPHYSSLPCFSRFKVRGKYSGPGIQERSAPAAKPPLPCIAYSSTYTMLPCPHLTLHRVD